MGGFKKNRPLVSPLYNTPILTSSSNPSDWTEREHMGQRWSFVLGCILSSKSRTVQRQKGEYQQIKGDLVSFKTMLSHPKLNPAYLRMNSFKYAIEEELHSCVETKIELNSIQFRANTKDVILANSRWLQLANKACHTPITLLRRFFAIKGTVEAFLLNDKRISPPPWSTHSDGLTGGAAEDDKKKQQQQQRRSSDDLKYIFNRHNINPFDEDEEDDDNNNKKEPPVIDDEMDEILMKECDPNILEYHEDRDRLFGQESRVAPSIYFNLHTPEIWPSAQDAMRRYSMHATTTTSQSDDFQLPEADPLLKQYIMMSFCTGNINTESDPNHLILLSRIGVDSKPGGGDCHLHHDIVKTHCLDHVICSWIRTYRFLSGLSHWYRIHSGQRQQHVHGSSRTERIPFPVPDFDIDYDLCVQDYQIPIPSQLHEDRTDIIQLFLSGHGVLATTLWRLFHQHRILRYAKMGNDPYMYHIVQLLIDSHLPTLGIMIKLNRWSDDSLLNENLTCANAKELLSEEPMHPMAPSKLQERTNAFVDVANNVPPSLGHILSRDRRISDRIKQLKESQSQKHPRGRNDKITTPHVDSSQGGHSHAGGNDGVDDAMVTETRPYEKNTTRRLSASELKSMAAKEIDEEDQWIASRSRNNPNHGATGLSLDNSFFTFWPLSVSVMTWEECSKMTRGLIDNNIFYEDNQRREEWLFSSSIWHLLFGKTLPHKCKMRSDTKMTERYFQKHPSISNQIALFLQLMSYGNIPDFTINKRPNFSTRVRLWNTFKFELANTPKTWLAFMKQHRFTVQNTLKGLLAYTVSSLPELERVLRQRPKYGLWRTMVDFACDLLRRRLESTPYNTRSGDSNIKLAKNRQILLYTMETETILSRIHKITSKKAYDKLHKGNFNEILLNSFNKFYQMLQSTLETMKAEHSNKNNDPSKIDNRRMSDVFDGIEKSEKLKWVASERPAEYDDHMMRIFAWRVARYNINRTQLPTYFLPYFGVPENVVHTLRLWILYFNVYDMSDNWYQHQISLLWQRYPSSFCVIWAYLNYLLSFQSEVEVVLPAEVRDLQLVARKNALDINTYDHDYTKKVTHIFYWCSTCKKWNHPVAPICHLINIAGKPGERFLDPIEQAIQKQLFKGNTIVHINNGNDTMEMDDHGNAFHNDELEDDFDDDDEYDDDEAEGYNGKAKKTNVSRVKGGRRSSSNMSSSSRRRGRGDVSEGASTDTVSDRNTARNTISTLSIFGTAPSAYISNGSNSTVGVHVLNNRSGVAVNGSGMGTTTESSGLFSADMTRQQYDPIKKEIKCAYDRSKRTRSRNHRIVFNISQTYFKTGLKNTFPHAKKEINTTTIEEYFKFHRSKPDMNEYYTENHMTYNSITKLMHKLVVNKLEDDKKAKLVEKENKKKRRRNVKNGTKKVDDDVGGTSNEDLEIVNSDVKMSPPSANIDMSNLPILSNHEGGRGGGGDGEDDDDDEEDDLFAQQISAELLHYQDHKTLQRLLNDQLAITFSEVPSSVTRAKRCKAELIPVNMIGRIFPIKKKLYVLCSACCTLMLALPSYYIPEMGFVCSRHGMSNHGFDPKTGTLLASPHAKVQTNLSLEAVGNKGFLRLTPTFYITRLSQLNGIPSIWLLNHGYHDISEWLMGTTKDATYRHTPPSSDIHGLMSSGRSDIIYNRLVDIRTTLTKDSSNAQSMVVPTIAAKGFPFMHIIYGIPHGTNIKPTRAFRCDQCQDKYYLNTILVNSGRNRLCVKHWKAHFARRAINDKR